MIIENWLSVGAGVFLIGMVLYGHYRGFLKQCVSLGALVLTIVIVKIATPYMTGFIKDNPSIRQGAADAILSIAGWEEPSVEDTGLPSAQRMSIERLNLPQSVKDVLLENNNSEIYKILGVDQFAEYVSMYLADMLINAIPVIYSCLCIDPYGGTMAGSYCPPSYTVRTEPYSGSAVGICPGAGTAMGGGICAQPVFGNACWEDVGGTGLCQYLAYVFVPV